MAGDVSLFLLPSEQVAVQKVGGFSSLGKKGLDAIKQSMPPRCALKRCLDIGALALEAFSSGLKIGEQDRLRLCGAIGGWGARLHQGNALVVSIDLEVGVLQLDLLAGFPVQKPHLGEA